MNTGTNSGGFGGQGQGMPFDQFGMSQPSSSVNFNIGNGNVPTAMQMMALQRQQQQQQQQQLQQQQMQQQQQQQRSVSIASTTDNPQNTTAAPNTSNAMDQLTQMSMYLQSGLATEAQAQQIRQRIAQALAQQQAQQQAQQGIRSQTPAQGMYWNNTQTPEVSQQQLENQWIQQSLRNQQNQQASIQAQALAQARAQAGTPSGQNLQGQSQGSNSGRSSLLEGSGMSMGPPMGYGNVGNANGMQGGFPGQMGNQGGQGIPWNQPFQQQQMQNSPLSQMQGINTQSFQQLSTPQHAHQMQTSQHTATPTSVGRMSVPPRPTSAASQQSQYSAAPQPAMGTPTPATIPKLAVNSQNPNQSSQGAMQMMQGQYGNLGMGIGMGMPGVQRQPSQTMQQQFQQAQFQQGQRLHSMNASSPSQTQGSPFLGMPQNSTSQSPSSHPQTTNPAYGYNPMGPPQAYQGMQTSPAAQAGTPTPTLGKRKMPGSDVADGSREQSVLGETPGSAKDSGKPVKQPRKKKEKEEKPPKVTKAQQRQMEKEQKEREHVMPQEPALPSSNGTGPAQSVQPPSEPPRNQMPAAMLAAFQQQKSFPFDPRLSYYVKAAMQSPASYESMIQQNPSMEAQLSKAINLVKSGQVSPEMVNNMIKFTTAMAHFQQQRTLQQRQQMQRASQSSQPPATPQDVAQVPGAMPPPPRRDSQVGVPAEVPAPAPGEFAAPRETPAPVARVAPPPMEEWQRYLPSLARLTSIAPLPQDVDERVDPTFHGVLPELTEQQLYQYRAWLDKDIEYTRTLEVHRTRMTAMTGEWLEKSVRPAWWQMDMRGDKPPLTERMSIVWPIEKAAARKHKRPQKGRVPKAMAEYYTKAEAKAADVPERLVPIRLDMEIVEANEDSRRYRDTFLWNAADTSAKLDKFVETICEDFQIRPERHRDRIRAAIEEQIKQGEFLSALPTDEEPVGLSAEDLEWWKQQRLVTVSDSQESLDLIEEDVYDDESDDDMDERPETVDTLMAELQSQNVPEDLRIKIQLDIVSGTMHLSDTFEWELTSTVTPEEFAEVYAADLGLNGEFKTAIAHDIREQVYLYLKSLALLGYAFDGSAISDIDLKQEFLPALTDPVRRDENTIAQFTPFLVNVTEADIERLETERERITTKKKRATRGRRGVVLPDREPIRTVRMRIGGEVDDFGRPLARLHGPREPFVVRPAPPRRPVATSRRAAAVAARANITEMSTDQDDKFEALPPPSPARLKRARVATTPAPLREDTPGGSARLSKLSERLIPKEERMSVPLDKAEESASRPGSSSAWKCDSCGRPESGLKDMHKAAGPNGPDTVCSSCAEQLDAARPASKDGPVKTSGSRSRDDSPAPFPDVASPESTSSSSGDGLVVARPKPVQKRSNTDRKLQTPLAHTSKPLPTTPDAVPVRSPAGRVSESPAKTTPLLGSLGMPSNRPPTHRAVSHQPPEPAWLATLLTNLRNEKPRERLQALYKGPPNPAPAVPVTEAECWRIKCLDCQGKIYSLGPGETLQNFEKHLRNKQHLANVDARMNATKP